jgi:hypothetical protein
MAYILMARIPRTLESDHLIRASSAGARWYELTHDRLIGSIIDSNGRERLRKSLNKNKRLKSYFSFGKSH